MNLKIVMLCGFVIVAVACNISTDTSPDIAQNAPNNNSIPLKIIGSWSLDLEAMKHNAPQGIQKNIEMLSMMGGDLFKIDIHGDGKIVESGLGGLNSVGKWKNNGNRITVTFEPNEIQKEILNREKDSSQDLTAEIEDQLQREIQLVGSHLIFEFSMGPKILTFYLKKTK